MAESVGLAFSTLYDKKHQTEQLPQLLSGDDKHDFDCFSVHVCVSFLKTQI